MKNIFLIGITGLLSLLLSISAFAATGDESGASVDVLLLVGEEYGPNTYHLIDYFERHGWNVTTTGLEESARPCSPFASVIDIPHMAVDVLVSDIPDVSAYDCLVIMYSTTILFQRRSYDDLLSSQEALNLISRADENGLVLFAPCAGVRMLAAAGVLEGHRISANPDYQFEYEAAGAEYLGTGLPPVIDGNIVTGTRGIYFLLENGEAIAAALALNRRGRSAQSESIPLTIGTAESNFADVDRDLWTRTYGCSAADGSLSTCATSDGGFVLTGYTFAAGSGRADLLVIKTDDEGNMQWHKTFGVPGAEYGYAISETSDGGYVVAGSTTSVGSGLRDIYVVKTDALGEAQWERTFGGQGSDVGEAIIETTDGDFVICGHTNSLGAGGKDVYLIKVDSTGRELWSRTYGGAESDLGVAVLEAAGGGYLVLGSTGSSGAGNRDVCLIRTDADGNQLWQKTYGGRAYDAGNSIIETSDGGYLIIGNQDTRGRDADALNVFVVKVDSDGEEVWRNSYGEGNFYDYGVSAVQLGNGSYVVCGATKSTSSGDNNIYLLDIDEDGSLLRSESFGGPGADWANSICLTGTGEVVLSGYTNSLGSGSYDIFLMKLRSSGDD